MKILSQIIVIIASVFIVPGNCHAAAKCVATLSSSQSCQIDSKIGFIGWQVTCGQMKLIGTGACSNISGGKIAAQADNIPAANSSDINKFCWCRMMSPAVSKWIFSYPFSSAAECAYGCGYRCGADMNTSVAARSAIFKDLI